MLDQEDELVLPSVKDWPPNTWAGLTEETILKKTPRTTR